MARLFSAFVPPESVSRDLAERVDAVSVAVPDLRWTPAGRWHVTLGFFGDGDDPTRRSAWLRRRVTGRPAPAVRLVGVGRFPGVLWIGLAASGPPDAAALARLAQAAGAGRRGYRPHLTVARWRGGADQARAHDLLADYTGPWFTPSEVVLLRSDPGSTGPIYTPIERVALRVG